MSRRAWKPIVVAVILVAVVVPPALGAQHPSERQSGWSSTLEAVSGDTSSDVWAVGWRHRDEVRKTLVQHWDGRRWTTVPSPNRSLNHDDVLTGVTAISPTDVWAVGFYGSPSGYRTLTLHWDGVGWTHVPSPSGHHYSILQDVSAAGPDDVWAVGAITKHDGQWYRGLLVHWDGESWSVVDSTTPRRRIGGLATVSAVSRDDVWAAAGNGFGAGAIYHFDGSSWAERDAGLDGTAQSISMDSATDGWAVGGGLTLHWDGHSWEKVANPVGYLEAVAAYAPDDAWAAGDVLEHWDGVRWTATGQSGGDVFGLDMLAPDDVWAVGGWPTEAKVLHWDGTRWSAVE